MVRVPNVPPTRTASLGAQCWPYLRSPVQWTFGLGLVTNLLALSSTWYMLQVYDRVITSMSLTTLAMVTLLVVGAYALLEVMEWVRHGLMTQVAEWLHERFAGRLYAQQLVAQVYSAPRERQASLQDLATVKQLLSSPVMLAVLDVPYALLVLLILLAIHPLIAALSLGFVCLQGLSGWFNDRSTREPLRQAAAYNFHSHQMAQSVLRSPQATQAMGMTGPLYQTWQSIQAGMLHQQALASVQAGVWSSTSKLTQTLLSSLLIGLGCLLTLEGSLDPHGGMIIVGSVLGSRLMAPMAVAIPHWRQVLQAQMAWSRLSDSLQHLHPAAPAMPLPAPRGNLEVTQVSYQTPAGPVGPSWLLRGIQFSLKAGETLCILGPTGSGKTTLVRLLVGLMAPTHGTVRLDGVSVHTWSTHELGPHVGYVPAQVELLEGSIGHNIARFTPCETEEVVQAAQGAGLDAWIRQLPQGYDTPVGQEGSQLSVGMRQRIALARALFRQPQLLVLDEPNASLDDIGNAAFLHALKQAQARGATVVVVTHRMDVAHLAHQLLILHEGRMLMVGPTQEVLQKLQPAPRPNLAAA